MVLGKLPISQTDNINTDPPAQEESQPKEPPDASLSRHEQDALESMAILQAIILGISVISYLLLLTYQNNIFTLGTTDWVLFVIYLSYIGL
jgi:hypothetical protein